MAHVRNVHVQRGQRIIVHAGRGAMLEVEREASGAVVLRSLNSGHILRQWSPKEARQS